MPSRFDRREAAVHPSRQVTVPGGLLRFYAVVFVWLATVALHIPDGFLATPVSIVGWVLCIATVAYALRGVLAAFIFAAQAINFPVAGGTSGHLLGGALAAIIMGPWAAVLIMTSVIAVQGLVFQDGGVLVMGWNVLNMGVLTAFTGYFVYRVVRRCLGEGRRTLLAAGAVGAWLSVMVGAMATAIELAVSGTSPLTVALPAMLGVHALIGVGEALITVGALAFLHAARRDLLGIGEAAPGRASAGWVGGGLALALLVAAFSFAASSSPDGLERVAEDAGFLDRALEPLYNIFPDYSLPFASDPLVSGILAVVGGTLLVFGLALLVARLQARRKANA
jgi:cobalt/nickel transport system permease protein